VYLPDVPILSGIVSDQGLSLNTAQGILVISELCTCFRADLYGFRCPADFSAAIYRLYSRNPGVIMFQRGFWLLALVHVWWFPGSNSLIHSNQKIMAISSKTAEGKLLGAVIMGILSAFGDRPCVTAP